MIAKASETFQFDAIDDVVSDIAKGRIVIVTDDADRENEGDLVMAAEKVTLAAEKEGRRIAVEVQSFAKLSPVRALEEAVGQYDVYRTILEEIRPGLPLYMAVPRKYYENQLKEPFGQLIVTRLKLRLLVFDESEKRIVQWIE